MIVRRFEQKQFIDDEDNRSKGKKEDAKAHAERKEKNDAAFEAGKKKGFEEGVEEGKKLAKEESEKRAKELAEKEAARKKNLFKKIFKIDQAENKINEKKANLRRWVENPANHKKIRIGTYGTLAAIGTTAAGAVAIKKYKHHKEEKRVDDLRKKVAGYDSSKKK